MLSQRFVARANKRPGASRGTSVTRLVEEERSTPPWQTMRSEYPREFSFCRLFPKERSIFFDDSAIKKTEGERESAPPASMIPRDSENRVSLTGGGEGRSDSVRRVASLFGAICVSISENLAVNLDDTRNHHGDALSRRERARDRDPR